MGEKMSQIQNTFEKLIQKIKTTFSIEEKRKVIEEYVNRNYKGYTVHERVDYSIGLIVYEITPSYDEEKVLNEFFEYASTPILVIHKKDLEAFKKWVRMSRIAKTEFIEEETIRNELEDWLAKIHGKVAKLNLKVIGFSWNYSKEEYVDYSIFVKIKEENEIIEIMEISRSFDILEVYEDP